MCGCKLSRCLILLSRGGGEGEEGELLLHQAGLKEWKLHLSGMTQTALGSKP